MKKEEGEEGEGEEEKEEDRKGQVMLIISAHLEVCLLEWESSLPL